MGLTSLPSSNVLEIHIEEEDLPRRVLPPPEQEEPTLTECGFLNWRPKILHRFRSPNFFLFLLCTQITIHTSGVTLLLGFPIVIKKLLKITEISMLEATASIYLVPLLLSLPLSHFIGKLNKPRWLVFFMILDSIGFFMLYGVLISKDTTYLDLWDDSTKSISFCNDVSKSDVRSTFSDGATKLRTGCSYLDISFYFWISGYSLIVLCANGIWITGLIYLDWNSKGDKRIIYFALSIAAKLLGCVLGNFMFSFLGNKEDDNERYEYRNNILFKKGPFIFASSILVLSFFALAFPKTMITPKRRPVFHLQTEDGEISAIEITKVETKLTLWDKLQIEIREMVTMFGKVTKNFSLIMILFSFCISSFGASGFFLYLPQHLQNHFRVDRNESATYTGIANTSSIIIGVVGGSLIIKQMKPSSKSLFLIMGLCKITFAAFLTIMMFIRCEEDPSIPGIFDPSTSYFNPQMGCSTCNCSHKPLYPICVDRDDKRVSFLSPCHAGCYQSESLQDTFNCSCSNSYQPRISIGYCRSSCSNFTIYNMLSVISSSLVAVGAISGLLLVIRIVSKEELPIVLGTASLGLTLTQSVVPVAFKAVIESSCVYWQNNQCQEKHCVFYNSEDFGYKLHSLSSITFVISFIIEVMLSFKQNEVKLYENKRSPVFSASNTNGWFTNSILSLRKSFKSRQ